MDPVAWICLGFLIVFTVTLIAAFGLALSHIQDSGVLILGTFALIASITGVAVQGLQLRARIDSSEHQAMSNTERHSDQDKFIVRSYSLIAQPDMMALLQANFTSASLLAEMSERAFVRCGITVSMQPVTYESDIAFLVISKGASGDSFRMDVMEGRVSTIMLGGGLLRVVSLTALDFVDTDNIAMNMTTGNDIYVLSARGAAGATPDSPNCQSIDTIMPWDGQLNNSAVTSVSAIMAVTGKAFPLQVWGIGGR